jgi:hypothetical protein
MHLLDRRQELNDIRPECSFRNDLLLRLQLLLMSLLMPTIIHCLLVGGRRLGLHVCLIQSLCVGEVGITYNKSYKGKSVRKNGSCRKSLGHTVIVKRECRERLSYWDNTWMMYPGPDFNWSEGCLICHTVICKDNKNMSTISIQSNFRKKNGRW